MTLSAVPPATAPPRFDPAAWAVGEIRPDGTLGRAELVGSAEEAAASRRTPLDRRQGHSLVRSKALRSRLGQLQASHGRLDAAVRVLEPGLRDASDRASVTALLGPLALVEAVRGDLRSAQRRVDRVLGRTPGPADVRVEDEGVPEALLAQAWIHLERGQHEQCALVRARVETPVLDVRDSSWLSAATLMLDVRLLQAQGRPEAAIRLLAEAAADPGSRTRWTRWTRALLITAHAEALLAAGEPRRALAALTPAPTEAVVEAGVVTAAARHRVGDVRGASAVLARVVDVMDRAPVGTQLRAWVLEARLADDRGDTRRVALLVNRVLRVAATDDLRAPVLRDWGWLRARVERDPALLREHREFLTGLRDVLPSRPTPTVTRARVGGGAGGAAPAEIVTPLTERESEVLELLAQMCSTEEIAGALFVSSNTVKTHLKAIFGKLCVNRRVDAVRRGRQLGLC